jgi:hypothetical protein
VICDNALVTGFALDRQPVGRDVVLEVCRDDFVDATPPVDTLPAAAADPFTAAGLTR